MYNYNNSRQERRRNISKCSRRNIKQFMFNEVSSLKIEVGILRKENEELKSLLSINDSCPSNELQSVRMKTRPAIDVPNRPTASIELQINTRHYRTRRFNNHQTTMMTLTTTQQINREHRRPSVCISERYVENMNVVPVRCPVRPSMARKLLL